MGIPWQAALGAVFLSGVAFLLLTVVGVRQLIVEAIPAELYSAVAAGIGLFIAMIGLRNAGIIVASKDTLVTLGNLRDQNTAAGHLRTAADGRRCWRGASAAAMLIGILGTTLAGALCGSGALVARDVPRLRYRATAGKLDIRAALESRIF